MGQQDLASRYGKEWDFSRLSDRQRALLLDESLYNLRASGSHQVWIDAIGTEGGRPVLKLQDTLYYLFRRNMIPPWEHAERRTPVYKRILGFEGEPAEIDTKRTGYTYLFDLQGSGQVVVWFDSVKDRE